MYSEVYLQPVWGYSSPSYLSGNLFLKIFFLVQDSLNLFLSSAAVDSEGQCQEEEILHLKRNDFGKYPLDLTHWWSLIFISGKLLYTFLHTTTVDFVPTLTYTENSLGVDFLIADTNKNIRYQTVQCFKDLFQIILTNLTRFLDKLSFSFSCIAGKLYIRI